MKKIKYLILVSLVFLALFVSACKKELTESEILDKFISSLNFDENLNKDLDLKTTYSYEGKTISATWESSNDKIITNDGKLNYSLSDEIVTISGKFILGDQEASKEFEFFISGNAEKAFEGVYNSLNIPNEVSSSIELNPTISYGGKRYNVTYTSSDESILSNEGKITYSLEDKNVELTVKITYPSTKEYKEYTKNIKINKIDASKLMQELVKAGKDAGLDNDVEKDVELPTSITFNNETLPLTWETRKPDIISKTGKVTPANIDTSVTLVVKTILDISYSFDFTVKATSDLTSIEKALEEIIIPSKIQSDIILNQSYSYNTSASWSSSNETILSNTGAISKTLTKYENVVLTLTLSKGESHMEKKFNVCVANEAHLFQDRTFEGTKSNVHVENNKLVLDDEAKEGYYETNEITVDAFTDCVGSYASTSSKDATCELLVKVYSNNKWSKYLSYGVWGKELKNAMGATSDTYVKQVEDEIIMIGSNVATKFQMKLVLRRNSTATESPKVSLLSLAIHYSNYSYPVDISTIPSEVKYDVPCLYQHDVPVIGNSICSATSSTMLLKWKGHDFKGCAQYEHEYIANVVKDYGNDIFGNWVYNTIGMSSFGEISYVKRFYSYQELLKHLATVGPVSASIKGTTITNKKTYTTAGHLIVVTGYKIDGQNITMYINDPNVPGVEVTMTLDNFLNVYRMVSYIIE